MSYKPILFSTPMVQAIQEGRKSMTRRAIRPKILDRGTNWLWTPNENVCLAPYQPGDVLWVRETWGCYDDFGRAYYRADYPEGATGYWFEPEHLNWCDLPKWRPSIFMPRAAARTFLRVTNVRVERLQEISDEDAIREGANFMDGRNVGFEEKMRRSAVDRFWDLWDRINAKRAGGAYAWEQNPWVWVIAFQRIEKPEGWPCP